MAILDKGFSMSQISDFQAAPAKELAIRGGRPIRPKPIEADIHVSELARERVLDLLDGGKLSDYYNGPWAHQLEAAFAEYHGLSHRAVAVNSGTSALHLAVTAAGIGPGDEVIVPAFCFVAAAIAVVQNGGIPVICDAEPESLTLDTERVEALIGPRTKAILPVHFWGYPSNLPVLREICSRNGLLLIEDCAQALGASADGKKVGTFGDYAAYAFSVRKHIACGEGGMVLCHTEDGYERVRRMSNYGKGPGWDDYISIGFSYRLTEFSSIVALDGLGRLDEEVCARQQAGRYYIDALRDSSLTVVPEPRWGGSVYFKCPILLPTDSIQLRQKVVDAIGAENVSCRVPHRPLYSIPWLSDYLKQHGAFRGTQECPVAAANHPRLIEIESGPHLSLEEARLTSQAVLNVWRHFAA
jgi:perosamine synthetase